MAVIKFKMKLPQTILKATVLPTKMMNTFNDG